MDRGNTTCGRKSSARRFMPVYTLMWAVCALAIVAVFRLGKASFLFQLDGMYQHYSAYEYVCRTLRALLRGNPEGLGFFDYTLGQGADVLTTLNSYDFTDPVCWLTALLPATMLTRYTLMIFVKLYLIGLSFGLYCRETGRRDGWFNALGAVCYTFSTVVLFTLARHPNYISWAYYLPLMMAGGQRYWRRGRGGLLIAAVFLNLTTNYYTFYINAAVFALFVAVRAVYRCFEARDARRAGPELLCCVKTAGVCLLGVLLGMAALLPTLYVFLNNARLTTSGGLPATAWHYSKKFYRILLSSPFLSYSGAAYYSRLGLNAMIMPALSLLLLDRKRWGLTKVCLVGCTVMMACPLVGRALNGFDYASNRWCYAAVFLVSVAAVDALPTLWQTPKWKRWALAALAAAYILFSLFFRPRKNYNLLAMAVVLAGCTLAVLLAGRLDRRRGALLLGAAVLAGALYQSVFCYLPGLGGGYLRRFLPAARQQTFMEDHSAAAARELADDGFYRVEEQEFITNTDGHNGTHGTEWWWSMLPAWMSDYYNAFALDTLCQNCNFTGLDSRTALLETASVKYYTAPAEDTSSVPWGYEFLQNSSDGAYAVYENRYALPVGYVYPGYMLRSDYEQLSALERQQAQLQCAVVDEPVAGVDAVVPAIEVRPVAHEFVSAEDVEVGENVLRARKNGTIRLKADIPEDCEIYVALNGMKIRGGTKGKMLVVNAARRNGDFSVSKKGCLFHSTYYWPVLRDQITYCLGSGAPGENEITLTFDRKAEVRYDSIQVLAVPMADYGRQAGALRANALRDARVTADRVEGSLSLAAPGVLQLSIPYSKGWTAWIDGVKAPVVRSDDMYMALPVDAGEHQVLLRYETPYLKLGAALSLATLIGLVAWRIVGRRREKRRG